MSQILTLPSDSCHAYFPNNKLSHYIVQLPYELAYSGAYEVALCQLQYTNSWINLPKRACQIRINYLGGPLTPVSQTAMTCKLTPGYYKNGIDLVNAVNTATATEILKTWELERES